MQELKRMFRAIETIVLNPDTWNRWRIKGKILLSRIAYSIILLIAFDTWVVSRHQLLIDPYVAIAGLIWLSLAAAVIWYRGGVAIDSLFGAEIVNLDIEGFKPGEEFVNALAVLGMMVIFTTSFFLFVPVWRYWEGFWMLLIVLIGWGLSSLITKSKFNWNLVRKTYIAITAGTVTLFFVIGGFQFLTGRELTMELVRARLQSGLGTVIMVPVLLIILGSIPKMPTRKFLRGLGVVSLAVIAFQVFVLPPAKKQWEAIKPGIQQQAEQPKPAVVQKFNFVVPPDRPSEQLSVPSKNFCIHVDGPEAVRIIDHDGQTLCHIGERLTPHILAEFQQGVRFAGPPSNVTVTLESRS